MHLLSMAGNETYLHELQNGHESGLHHFIQLYGKPLRFFAYNIIRNKEAAEEIVSDVFFKLWRARVNFATEQKIKAFLYIATRNACYDYLDSPKNRIHYDVDITDELPHAQPDLLVKIIEAELIELVYQEVNNLPDNQAAVFRMSYMDGMTTDEICDSLGMTANAVFLARSRALAKLRVVFKEKQLIWYLVCLQWLASNGG